MNKTDKRLCLRLGAAALSAVLLGTGAALAAGDQSDPLVTLSYLNQTALPQIIKQVEDKTAVKQKELEQAKALGFTDGKRPQDLASRQEVASMLLRALE